MADGEKLPPKMADVTDLAAARHEQKMAAMGYSEDELAQLFVDRHGEDWRYLHPFAQWLNFGGGCWRVEDTLEVFNLARSICREKGAFARDQRQGIQVRSAKTVAAVERMARADRKCAATVDQWDADPMTLACPGGTVNLQAGRTYPPMREDYCTKLAAVTPDAVMEAPLWDAFLQKVTGGNVALILYLQRVCGYCLTGLTSEHVLFFLYGTGANGKTVFVETISGILGEYAVTAPMETFTETAGERHPTELAALHGARLVTASETQSGRRWNESRIKALTGGDKIAARFMRQDFFEFKPVFKLMLCGNHKPALRNVDEAIRRRIHLVPFVVTIPPAERDLKLGAKLKAEWPGILQWILEGCRGWQAEGLNPPKVVVDATAEYLASEDALNLWLDDCCVRGANDKATSKELFESWRDWCKAANEEAGGSKGFSQRLIETGFKSDRIGNARKRGFTGLRLKSGDEELV